MNKLRKMSMSSEIAAAVFVAGGNGIPGIYSEIQDLAVRSKSI